MNAMQHNLSEQANDELWELASRYCNDSLDAAGVARLETLLVDDPQARSFLGVYASMHAELTWRFRGGETEVSEIDALDFSAVEPTDRPIATFPSLSPVTSSLSPSFVGGPVFSYMVATVVLCMMLLGAWAYKVSRVDHFPGDTAQTPIIRSQPTLIIVGRITGTKDCVWSDTDTSTILGAYVSFDREFSLSSGLLEITYISGAQVILEGPCNYTVDSETGGYLGLGKLMAKVATNPVPLFVIKTPSALVTDLGTEFGVEVDVSGDCWTHVFQGKVELKLTNAGENHRPVCLEKNDSARVIKETRKVEVTRGQPSPCEFVRSVPKRVRLKLHNTGIGAKEGEADPHWQIIAISDVPDFKPRQAVVTATPPYNRWLWNAPRRGQWISLKDGPADVPSGTYTFRTTFQLSKDGLNAAAISGSFWADNHVEAIRINGRSVKVSEHGYNVPFVEPVRFVVNEGFVEGENVLEFDVLNGGGDNAFPDMPNPMGLRVEMKSVVRNSVKTGNIEQPSQPPNNIQQKGDRK